MRLFRFLSLVGLVSTLTFGVAPLAHAIAVYPISPYVFNTTISSTPTLTIAGDVKVGATGPVTGNSGAGPDSGMFTGYTFFNLSDGFTTAPNNVPNQANLVMFDIDASGITPTAGNNLVIVATVGPSTGPVVIPIAAVDIVGGVQPPALCANPLVAGYNNVNCAFPTTIGSATLYQGAIVPTPPTASIIRIGLLPKDLCASSAVTTLATFCSGSNVNQPNSTTPTTMTPSPAIGLTFYAVSAPAGQVSVPSTSGASSSSLINLQIFDAPMDIAAVGGNVTTPNCNPFATAPYFPGDAQINLNASTMVPLTNPGSQNSPQQLVVVGEEGGVAPTAQLYKTYPVGNFPINVATNYSGQNTITGFTNSEPNGGTQHIYTLYFAYSDSAGILGPFTCTTLPQVQTAAIFGFLKKNGCFIATGAFHSEPAEGIRLLQRFRDQVLIRTELGRQIRNWYYDHSPRAAWWLLENPEFRFPVLRALLPFEAMAWILLHPLLAAMLGSLGVLVILGAVFARSRKGEGMA